jgi:hypothetical protein
MNALLNRGFLTAAATVVAGVLTYAGVIPSGSADSYIGEIVTGALAAAAGREAFLAYLARRALGGSAPTE